MKRYLIAILIVSLACYLIPAFVIWDYKYVLNIGKWRPEVRFWCLTSYAVFLFIYSIFTKDDR